MPKRFAEGTSVSVSRSREEIKKNLKRHGATGFLYGDQGNRAAIAFEMNDRRYRMELMYPSPDSFNPGHNQYSTRLSHAERVANAWEREKQRLWRGLALLVKAKLEAVASGISTLEEELLSYTVMPNDQTVGEWIEPQLDEVYRSGKMPPLIPGLTTQKQITEKIIDGEVL
jgi:hypothetical protein